MMDYEMLAAYEQTKEIIESTEKLIHEKYQECLDNDWMSDITEYLMSIKVDAFRQIKSLTKD